MTMIVFLQELATNKESVLFGNKSKAFSQAQGVHGQCMNMVAIQRQKSQPLRDVSTSIFILIVYTSLWVNASNR